MTAAPDILAPGVAARLVLLGARVSALLLVAPAFSATVVPRQVRAALAVVITVLLYDSAARGPIPTVSVPVLATNVATGLAIGAGAALLFAAAEVAGDVMSIQIGLSGASLLDPLQGTPALVLVPFTRVATLALLLSMGLHAVMLDALAHSFAVVPLGATGSLAGGAEAALRSASLLFAEGVAFAAPVMASALIVTLALALLTRAAPQVNAFAVAFPVQIGAGLVATGAAITGIVQALTHWREPFDGFVQRIISGFALTTS